MGRQIYADSWRIRGPLGMYDGRLAYDEFASTAISDSNRVPNSLTSSNARSAAWPKIDRREFYRSLYARVNRPSLIHQRGSSLCGPSSLLYLTAKFHPAQYITFMTQLYEYGEASFGGLYIAPGEDCRNYDPAGRMDPADWVGAAGIRDSENVFLDYDDVSDAAAGITLPATLARWLERVGYSGVINNTNLYFTKDEDDLRAAADLYANGYQICLFIRAAVLDEVVEAPSFIGQVFTIPNHWVVLTSPIVFQEDRLSLTVFSWGDGAHRVPRYAPAQMEIDLFEKFFYGYVACRP